jgi:hypothetical protein
VLFKKNEIRFSQQIKESEELLKKETEKLNNFDIKEYKKSLEILKDYSPIIYFKYKETFNYENIRGDIFEESDYQTIPNHSNVFKNDQFIIKVYDNEKEFQKNILTLNQFDSPNIIKYLDKFKDYKDSKKFYLKFKNYKTTFLDWLKNKKDSNFLFNKQR